MSYSYEVMQRTLDLTATMAEGIEHSRLVSGKADLRRYRHYYRIIQAYISIQQARHMGCDEITSSCFTDHDVKIRSGLSHLVAAYEQADWDNAIRALEYEVVLGFTRWKEEPELYYRHNVAS